MCVWVGISNLRYLVTTKAVSILPCIDFVHQLSLQIQLKPGVQ